MTSTAHLLDEAARRMAAGDFAGAGLLAQQALAVNGDDARALCMLGIAAAETGQVAVALSVMEHAIERFPHLPAVTNNAAAVFARCGDAARALGVLLRMAATTPDSAELQYNIGMCRLQLREPEAAIAHFRRVIQLQPEHPHVYSNLGNVLKDLGRIEDAIDVFREGVRNGRQDVNAHSNLIYAMHFDARFGPEDIGRECAEWACHFTAALPGKPRGHDNDRSPNRRLRIGYVSPYFRDHAEAYFILPLFGATDRSAFEVYAYSCDTQSDDVTRMLRDRADVWRDVAGLDDDALVEQIRSDRIDVLVDLTMHLAGQRLGVFARKPAPVQVTWLAYPGTTGLAQIDYRLTDPHLDPLHDPAYYAERSYVLPKCFWVYEVYGPRPDVSPLPADGNGYVTFGCLNNYGKVSTETIAAWSRILRALPDAKLVVLTGSSQSAADSFRQRLAAEGVNDSRIETVGYLTRDNYLKTYQRIDVALDTFPYNGATTTCDALWMGVPVVSRYGTTAVSRAGLSILTNVGLPELATASWDEYVHAACDLADDLTHLRKLRSDLRLRLEHSPVMDARGFAAAAGDAYRTMWRRWCES